MMLWMLNSTSPMVLAPVQTILPLEKIRADVFGSLIRKTNPGNCSGLYSVLGSVAAIFSKGISFSNAVETTILTILISFLACLVTIDDNPLFWLYKAVVSLKSPLQYLSISFINSL